MLFLLFLFIVSNLLEDLVLLLLEELGVGQMFVRELSRAAHGNVPSLASTLFVSEDLAEGSLDGSFVLEKLILVVLREGCVLYSGAVVGESADSLQGLQPRGWVRERTKDQQSYAKLILVRSEVEASAAEFWADQEARVPRAVLDSHVLERQVRVKVDHRRGNLLLL